MPPSIYTRRQQLPANAMNYHDALHCFQISKDVIGFYDTVYDRGLQETIAEKKEAAAAVLKVFHESVSYISIYSVSRCSYPK